MQKATFVQSQQGARLAVLLELTLPELAANACWLAPFAEQTDLVRILVLRLPADAQRRNGTANLLLEHKRMVGAS